MLLESTVVLAQAQRPDCYASPADLPVQAAKGAAGAIRSFQPALREISQVSSELRTNISSEMGLDELQREFDDIRRNTRDSMSFNSPSFSSPQTRSSSMSADESKATPSGEDGAAGGAGEGGGAVAAAAGVAERNGESAEGSNGASSAGDGVEGLGEEERRALTEISAGLNGMDEAQASRHAASTASGEHGSNGSEAGGVGESAEELQQLRAQSAAMAWGGGNVPQTLEVSDGDRDAALRKVRDESGEKKRLEDMTVTELEAELSKRRVLMKKIAEAEASQA